MDINRVAKVGEGEFVNSREEFVTDPLQHKAVWSNDGQRSISAGLYGEWLDPCDKLLGREFFLELRKTGVPKSVHRFILYLQARAV